MLWSKYTLGKIETEKICPAKRRVLFLIMTDGLENVSREYNKSPVKSLIASTTKEYSLNFIFIGANIDSVSETKSLGISAKNAANFSHDRTGVQFCHHGKINFRKKTKLAALSCPAYPVVL